MGVVCDRNINVGHLRESGVGVNGLGARSGASCFGSNEGVLDII